ncbi:MAG: GGDEF domain-containing protein, partial [Gammaproteobacteria bacterium]|nr:GGDEF domain-containing protein [Gammaproteobacteria bacterium]
LRYAVERQRLITELEQARELANYQAMHDVLTGLPNRALFFDRLEQVIRSSDRQHQTFGLAFLDFDDFKGVNDDYGHAIGDLLLIEASHRLRSAVRRSDTVARLGGDEFTIIFERLPDRETAEVLIAGLCDRLATPFHLNGQSLDIKVSIGLAVFPEDGADAQTLLHAADSKMYRSKRRGKLELQVIAGQAD